MQKPPVLRPANGSAESLETVQQFAPSISASIPRIGVSTQVDLYLDLLKRTLTRAVVAEPFNRFSLAPHTHLKRKVASILSGFLRNRNLELVRIRRSSISDYVESCHESMQRVEGAETMIGLRQLDHMQTCIRLVIEEEIEGDLLEAGVWRGGMTIFMRGVLAAHGDVKRKVWVVDSFEGLPAIDASQETFPWRQGDMAVPLEAVSGAFARFGLNDDQVKFVKGYFVDSLPTAPIRRLSVLRLDADLYQSTRDALELLYPKLTVGGFAVFDDYQNLTDCRRAIDEYRATHGITEEIHPVDSRASYWRRLR